jgi:hypothetical protein
MKTGYDTVQLYERVLEKLNELGLAIGKPLYGDNSKQISVVPIQDTVKDSVPVYNREAHLFTGSLEDVENWIDGVEWARQYDMLLFGKKHNDNRKREEQNVRNKKLSKKLTQ